VFRKSIRGWEFPQRIWDRRFWLRRRLNDPYPTGVASGSAVLWAFSISSCAVSQNAAAIWRHADGVKPYPGMGKMRAEVSVSGRSQSMQSGRDVGASLRSPTVPTIVRSSVLAAEHKSSRPERIWYSHVLSGAMLFKRARSSDSVSASISNGSILAPGVTGSKGLRRSCLSSLYVACEIGREALVGKAVQGVSRLLPQHSDGI
jgi:hypothetical protein